MCIRDSGISKAFTSIKPDSAFKGLKDSALARTHADWVIGMNGTRAITGWSSKAYNVGFNKQVVGRVKTPTLALVVKRDIEIEDFISLPLPNNIKCYWLAARK